MKKITLLFLLCISATIVNAGGNWATCVVSISKDGGSAYNYLLNNEGWTNGNWTSDNTAINLYDFGTPTSLILNGASGNAWTDDVPGYTENSFKLYYRVYLSSATPGSWNVVNLTNPAYNQGNNKIYDKQDANIDILALATIEGTNSYTLELTMSKNQDWGSGTWNSMIPGGQSVAYDAATSGYKATFTKSITTQLESIEDGLNITTNNGKLNVRSPKETNIEIYTISGQLIHSENCTNQLTMTLKNGVYLLKTDYRTYKVLIK